MPQLLNPGLLWWLAAAVPAITILYFLKLRRTESVVSSTLLWKTSVHDLRVNAPIQMIRRNLLWLLQILIICFIIYALARPFTKVARGRGQRAALIVDCSASMATRDEDGGSRLEAAKAEAIRIIDELGARTGGKVSELCVIAAADRPLLMCGLTSDRQRLKAAVQQITVKNSRTNMAAAIEMAIGVTEVAKNRRQFEMGGEIKQGGERLSPEEEKRLLASREKVETVANVILLSDGAFRPIPDRLAEKLAVAADEETGGSGGSSFVSFGKTESDNLAIVSLDLRVTASGTTGRQLFVRVENMGLSSQSTQIQVYLNDTFFDQKKVTVPARGAEAPGQVGGVFSLGENAAGVVRVELGSKDSFPLDDKVMAIIRPAEMIRVLLVSEGNYFLEHVLGADQHNVVCDRITPGEYPAEGTPRRKKDDKPYELIIFDSFQPPSVPSGATVFINSVPDLPGVELVAAEPALSYPVAVDWKRAHPLMRNLMLLDQIAILRCKHLKLSGAWATVVEGEGKLLTEDEKDIEKINAAPDRAVPLVGCLVTEERRVGLISFDIMDSQWVMRVSFPLFIRNLVHWLARPGGLQKAELYLTGDSLRVQYDEDVSGVSVKAPSGKTFSPPAASKRSVYFSQTYELGLYEVSAAAQPVRRYAFNLLSSDESDNRGHKEIALGRHQLEAGGMTQQNTDLWPFVVLAALALLLGEWYLYNRRILG